MDAPVQHHWRLMQSLRDLRIYAASRTELEHGSIDVVRWRADVTASFYSLAAELWPVLVEMGLVNLPDPPPSRRPDVVCLCGSTRFRDEFAEVARRLTVEGRIVLTMHEFGNDGNNPLKAHLRPIDPVEKLRLDELHKRKIDLADRVHVVNVGGYIGDSTRSEIAYAEARNIPVTYLEWPREEPCCHLHLAQGCCDPNDCGSCCERCPTCPTLARHRP